MTDLPRKLWIRVIVMLGVIFAPTFAMILLLIYMLTNGVGSAR